MNRRFALRVAAALTLAGAAPALSAAPAHAEEGLTSPLVRFLPPPPAGWISPMPPNVTEDLNGMEPSVSQGYGPETPGAKGFIAITINRPSPHDMETAFPKSRPLGPNPMAPWMVTSREKVNELDAYLFWNSQQDGGGVLEMRVGRVLVGIQGGAVSKEQLLAFARSIDTARLLKY